MNVYFDMQVILIQIVPLQAFLEFEDKANAVKMVNYYKNKQCSLRRKTCYVQFSNHQELKTSAQDMKVGFII